MNRTSDLLLCESRWQASAARLPLCVAVAFAALLAGCGTSLNRAPVEDRAAARTPATANAPASVPTASAEVPGKPLPGVENLGKPGYYAVKPGDTLIRLALENGQSWRDVARWNNIDNPNVLEVGQVLRVVPPGVDASAAAARPVTVAKVDTKPLDAKPITGAASAPAAAPPTAAAAPTPVAVAAPAPAATPPAAAPPAAARDADDDVAWAWPSTATRGCALRRRTQQRLGLHRQSR